MMRRTFVPVCLSRVLAESPKRRASKFESVNEDWALATVQEGMLSLRPFGKDRIWVPFPKSPFEGKFRVTQHWAYDSSAVALLSNGPGARNTEELWVVSPQGRELWRSDSVPKGISSELAVSSGGRYVVGYTRKVDKSITVHLMTSDGVTVGPNLGISGEASSSLTWIPRTSTLGLSIGDMVCSLDPLSGELIDIRPGQDPRWSWQGTKIAFISPATERLEVCATAELDRVIFRSQRRVLSHPSALWSPDERFVVCNEVPGKGNYRTSAVCLYRIGDGKRIVLWNNAGVHLQSSVGWVENWRQLVPEIPK